MMVMLLLVLAAILGVVLLAVVCKEKHTDSTRFAADWREEKTRVYTPSARGGDVSEEP